MMRNRKLKPMLFNADNVRAILGNRKTVTRRVVKFPAGYNPKWTGYIPDGPVLYGSNNIPAVKSPYRLGDILYVRETWRIWKAHRYDADAYIEFKAGGDGAILHFQHGGTDSIDRNDYDTFIEKWGVGGKYHPFIHMPREVARIFLRVTDVRVERLQAITPAQCIAEGADDGTALAEVGEEFVRGMFNDPWNSTVKPDDRALYGWEANPWVWVISFERIIREET